MYYILQEQIFLYELEIQQSENRYQSRMREYRQENKAANFKAEIRKKYIQNTLMRKREQISSRHKFQQLNSPYQQVIFSEEITPKSKQEIFNTLQILSLRHSSELWKNNEALHTIFSILGVYMIQYEANQFQGERNYVILKIKNIMSKILANQIQWNPQTIQYIILGSSICMPVLLTVLIGFSQSLMPIYKKNIQRALAKISNNIENQMIYDKKLDSQQYLEKYTQTIINLYYTVPKIPLTSFNCVFTIFQLIAEYSNLIQSLKPIKYKQATYCNKNILQIINLNLVTILNENNNKPQFLIKFMNKVINSWDINIEKSNKISFFRLIDNCYEHIDKPIIRQILNQNYYHLLYIFTSQLQKIKYQFNNNNKEDNRQILQILQALTNFLISDSEYGLIGYKDLTASKRQQFENLLKICYSFHEKLRQIGFQGFLKEKAYLLYSILQILPVQKIDNILHLINFNELLLDNIKDNRNISELVIWLRVLQSFIYTINRQKDLFIGNFVNQSLINLVSQLFTSHPHQNVKTTAYQILQVYAQTNQ